MTNGGWGAVMTRDGDNETPPALVVTADQMRTAVERLHGVYLARGYHTWSYWRNTEDADAALLDILLDFDDGDVFDRVWAETRSLPDRPEIRPVGSEAQS